MINWNIVLYIGLVFYVLIIVLFIANEMDKRKKDREQWLSNQLSKSFKPQLIPMTEEEEYRNAGITKEEINKNK